MKMWQVYGVVSNALTFTFGTCEYNNYSITRIVPVQIERFGVSWSNKATVAPLNRHDRFDSVGGGSDSIQTNPEDLGIKKLRKAYAGEWQGFGLNHLKDLPLSTFNPQQRCPMTPNIWSLRFVSRLQYIFVQIH